MSRFHAPNHLTLEHVGDRRHEVLSVGSMTDADLAAHPDEAEVLEVFARQGAVIFAREAFQNVGFIHVTADVDEDDLGAMHPYLQQATQMMETGAHDLVLIVFGVVQ